MSAFKQKRSRLPNFTEAEEKCLVEMAEQYIHIIESKKTDANTWMKKRYAWEQMDLEIEKKFGLKRGAKNIKEKYDNLKRKMKRSLDDKYRTHEDDVTKRLAAILNAAGRFNVNDDAGVAIEYEDETYLDTDLKEELSIDLDDHIIQDAKPQENEEPSSDVFSWKSAQKINDTSTIRQTSKNQNNKDLLTAPKYLFYKNEELRSAENHRLAAERHKLEVEKLRWELKAAKLKAKTFKQKLEQSPLVRHGSISPASVMCEADRFQMEPSTCLNITNSFAAQSPTIKVEPASDVLNTAAHDDMILPDTVNIHNKRSADADPSAQSNKRLRHHTHGSGDDQQQWEVALRNDVLYVHNSSESARLPAASTSEFGSDNGYNDDGNDDEAAGSMGLKHLQASDENIGSGFLKLLTKHKLQNYYVRLKEINIDLDCLKYIRETDIKDIFEKDIGGRIRFRGLVEEWRTTHMDFNGVLNHNIGSYAKDDDVVTKRDLKEMVGLFKDAVDQQTQIINQQNVQIDRIYGKLFGSLFTYNIPLQSLNDLDDIEEKINDGDFEKDIKILLKHNIQGKISKNLTQIISDELLKLINWNGRKNLIALGNYKFFSRTLYDAIKHMYTNYDDYQTDFRVAIGRGKNRLDQKRHNEKHIAELKSFIKDAQNAFFKEQQRAQSLSQRSTHDQIYDENIMTDHSFKEVLPKKQFQTVFDFKVFEELLRNSEEAYTNLIRELIDHQAKDSVSFVKSSWRRIMSDNVAKHFCWTGTPEKPAIRELRVTNALREAYHRKYKYASADEFQRTIIAFFQFAKVRLQKKESYEKIKACTTLSL